MQLPGASRHHWGCDFDVFVVITSLKTHTGQLELWEYLYWSPAAFYQWLSC
ncbi:D-alanyl-D-alanine carboxypeptidase family protein [Vibrio chagasii]|nr:D-alanyl-D-alanine carboxypeptidase family protein [Vibrio chagasii]